MSSSAVRVAFRTELQAAFPAIQYVEGVAENVDNESLQDQWLAMGFASFGEERMSIDPPSWWHETGNVRVAVAGVSGDGDSAIMILADDVLRHFRGWRSADGTIVVTTVQPPSDDLPESDGRWLIVYLNLLYVREFAE